MVLPAPTDIVTSIVSGFSLRVFQIAHVRFYFLEALSLLKLSKANKTITKNKHKKTPVDIGGFASLANIVVWFSFSFYNSYREFFFFLNLVKGSKSPPSKESNRDKMKQNETSRKKRHTCLLSNLTYMHVIHFSAQP